IHDFQRQAQLGRESAGVLEQLLASGANTAGNRLILRGRRSQQLAERGVFQECRVSWGGLTQDDAELQPVRGTDHNRVAAPAAEGCRAAESADLAGVAVADQVFAGDHLAFPAKRRDCNPWAYSKPKNSRMYWSYIAWWSSRLRSRRSSLM